MNLFKLYVSSFDNKTHESWEVSGESVIEAYYSLQSTKPNVGKLIGYKLLKKGGNDE